MTEQPYEIHVRLSDDALRVLAANPGSSLTLEREGVKYRSIGTDGADIVFQRVPTDPNVACVPIVLGPAMRSVHHG